MIKKNEFENAKAATLQYFSKAGIVISEKEKDNIEIADFGLNRLDEIGLEILVYVNTERCCAKELVLFPYQICPEHLHPSVNNLPGKEETFRCRYGRVFLYVDGEASGNISAKIPGDKKDVFTVKHEIILNPGEQYTLLPGTLHWFQAGPEGAVVSEFSTRSSDEFDFFTDQEIKRLPEVEE
jgi:D-lyxose ketol-isomerase